MGATSFIGHTLGRRTKPPSSAGGAVTGNERFDRLSEQEGEKVDEQGNIVNGHDSEGKREEEPSSDKDFKPVFLKGLFSVATTSTKSPSVIKSDVRRVLERMQVQYRETRTGFECIHLPSIDLSTLTEAQTQRYQQQRTIKRKSSKPLKGKEKDLSVPEEKEKTHQGLPSSGSSSFFNTHLGVPPNANNNQAGGEERPESPQVQPQESDPNLSRQQSSSLSSKGKYLPPIPRDFAANTGEHMKETSQVSPEDSYNEAFNASLQNSLAVRFEVNIVKVPWLPLHGIQFRRVGGDGWQYQMLARRVLTELKL